jgi:hypothetical protein
VNDFNPEVMIAEISSQLVKDGLSTQEAQKQATEQIDSMGATKTLTGKCPLGARNPMACMLCSYGHMVSCHYPLSCDEANCNHYSEDQE